MAIQAQEPESGSEGRCDRGGVGGRGRSGGLQEGGRKGHMVARLETRGLVLALQVLLGHLDIEQGHVGIVMPQ